MQRTILAWCLCLLPNVSLASPCPDFQWHYPAGMVEPESFMNARLAMEEGQAMKAREGFHRYVTESPEGVLAEGARYAIASLTDQENDPGENFLRIIDRLSEERAKNLDSPYAPWALCRIGELYEDAGWSSEALSTFEEFLEVYPNHPLSGGAMLGAGSSFLRKQQYLEAALVFRRVVEEPKWAHNHSEGALGLADATALSRAWKHALYWYRVVEAEDPDLFRQSPASYYRYGLAELDSGESQQAITRFLLIYNLYQDREEAGHALNRIAAHLLETHQDVLSLWFSRQASLRYKNREPGRRAEVASARWVASYLQKAPSKVEMTTLTNRLAILEISLAVSWDGVMKTTQALLDAPEPDLVDEARSLLAQALHAEGNLQDAVHTYGQLLLLSQQKSWRGKASQALGMIWQDQIRDLHKQQAWVELVTSLERHPELRGLVPLSESSLFMLADAYQQVGLPDRALIWFDEIFPHQAIQHHSEEILARKFFLAYESEKADLARQMAAQYNSGYPTGRWIGEIALVLGRMAFREQHYDQSIQRFSAILAQTHDAVLHTKALRERARAYRAAGQVGHAIKDYQRLVNEEHDEVTDRVVLADLLFEDHTYSKAAALYKESVDSEAAHELLAWAKYRLALSYQYMGRDEEATALLTELRQSGEKSEELETTLRAAVSAVLEEFSTHQLTMDISKNEPT